MLIKGNTKATLEGRGEMTIRPNDHIATGGEGSVYRASNSVIKLFSDLAKMKRDGMDEKIKLLSGINDPYIVSPKGLVIVKGKPSGYYMDFVEGEHLARVFTNAFRKRDGFTDGNASTLVDRMLHVVSFAPLQKFPCQHNYQMFFVVRIHRHFLHEKYFPIY